MSKEISDLKRYIAELIISGVPVKTYVKGAPVKAYQVTERTEGKTVLTDGTVERAFWVAEPGDWIATGLGGEQWNITAKNFGKLYDIPVGEDLTKQRVYIPKPIPRFCIQVQEDIAFPDPWEAGKLYVLNKGGFLNINDTSVIYGIGADEFKSTHTDAPLELKLAVASEKNKLLGEILKSKIKE